MVLLVTLPVVMLQQILVVVEEELVGMAEHLALEETAVPALSLFVIQQLIMEPSILVPQIPPRRTWRSIM